MRELLLENQGVVLSVVVSGLFAGWRAFRGRERAAGRRERLAYRIIDAVVDGIYESVARPQKVANEGKLSETQRKNAMGRAVREVRSEARRRGVAEVDFIADGGFLKAEIEQAIQRRKRGG